MRGVSFDRFTIKRLDRFRINKRDTIIMLINRALNTLEDISSMLHKIEKEQEETQTVQTKEKVKC